MIQIVVCIFRVMMTLYTQMRVDLLILPLIMLHLQHLSCWYFMFTHFPIKLLIFRFLSYFDQFGSQVSKERRLK